MQVGSLQACPRQKLWARQGGREAAAASYPSEREQRHSGWAGPRWSGQQCLTSVTQKVLMGGAGASDRCVLNCICCYSVLLPVVLTSFLCPSLRETMEDVLLTCSGLGSHAPFLASVSYWGNHRAAASTKPPTPQW